MLIEDIIGISDFENRKKIVAVLKALLAEFFGTFFLNFFGCGSVVVVVGSTNASGNPHAQPNAPVEMIAFCFGLTVFAIAQSIGHVSGAHINPAATIAMMSIAQISILKGILYIVVQCLGCLAGSATLMGLTPKSWCDWGGSQLGVTALSPYITPIQGFGMEFFLAFILLMTVSGVCDPNRPEAKPAGPLAIGLTITLCLCAGLKQTGASINPARSLGSAIIANSWEHHWVYWLGPISGATAAAQIYRFAFKAAKPEE